MGAGVQRTWRPAWPCPVGSVLSPLRRGAGDPTFRADADGARWRAFRSPAGPATLRIVASPREGTVIGTAWGAGADWALAILPRLLGADDDPAGFVPPAALAAAWRRHQHWRLGSSGLAFEALVPTILEQKVTGQEAFAGFRRLVRRFGEPAPGPQEMPDLWLQPEAATLRQVPSWEWLQLPVDPARSRAVLAVARVADGLQRAADRGPLEFDRAVRSIPGIGEWTSAEVRNRALGDADAVSFGDYHVAKDVGWALTGAPVDDAGLAELLGPYRPHRHRVQALVAMGGLGRPRRGPRMAPRTHLPAVSVAGRAGRGAR